MEAMSVRTEMKRLAQAKNWKYSVCLIYIPSLPGMFASTAPYYLVYFEKDEAVSVVSGSAVSVVGSVTETGSVCNVRVKGKVHEGKVVTHGECCKTNCIYCTCTCISSICR